jgi:hypothetical protein
LVLFGPVACCDRLLRARSALIVGPGRGLAAPPVRRMRLCSYLARHWPGGDRLRRTLAKGATFASCAVPLALRAVWAGRSPDSVGRRQSERVSARAVDVTLPAGQCHWRFAPFWGRVGDRPPPAKHQPTGRSHHDPLPRPMFCSMRLKTTSWRVGPSPIPTSTPLRQQRVRKSSRSAARVMTGNTRIGCA